MISIFRLFLSCATGFDPTFSRFTALPLCLKYKLAWLNYLLGDEGVGLQRLPPLVCDLYLLLSSGFILDTGAHLVRVLDDLLAVLGLKRVQDIEEVLPGGQAALGVLVGEVEHEPFVLLHHRPEVGDAELIVQGGGDTSDVPLLQEPLLAGEHELEEVDVDGALRRYVQLQLDKTLIKTENAV